MRAYTSTVAGDSSRLERLILVSAGSETFGHTAELAGRGFPGGLHTLTVSPGRRIPLSESEPR